MVAFLAWKDDKGNPMDKDSVAQDKIFYADWIDDIAPELDFTSTNNVAETQTVAMNMSDKGSGITEIYFGLQNPEETEVVFTPCTSAQSNQTVVEPGTYYMACKDTSGNMTCISADFFKITLDYGDATCPVRYIVGLEGNTVTLPNPEKLGYTFEGWEQGNLSMALWMSIIRTRLKNLQRKTSTWHLCRLIQNLGCISHLAWNIFWRTRMQSMCFQCICGRIIPGYSLLSKD